jgi:hypothetical protein
MASPYSNTQAKPSAEKAQAAGFINFNQPCQGGTSAKVSFKPLDITQHIDKQIYDMLHKDLENYSPEEAQVLLDQRATKWVRQLEATFRYGGGNAKGTKQVVSFSIVD